MKHIERPRWIILTFLLGVALAAHALYFDWADVVLKTALAVVVIVAALWWPRGAAASACVLLALTFAAEFIFATAAPEWATSVKPGDSWRSIENRLGVPTYSFASLEEAARQATGYAPPSPWRYQQGDAVAVFTRGEYALWVFHDRDSVKATFIGGS